ncbi:MAG TPA: hypothetical protein VFE88_03950 [Candidatus Nanoarchaeia archaeon]|nr:hypothetical protein [Candidatus Nanoarchaeia archaeon]
MDFDEFYQSLRNVDPHFELYEQFAGAAIAYYIEQVKLTTAETTRDPRTLQLREQVHGRLCDFRSTIKKINDAFQAHQPPLQCVPLTQEGLDKLVTGLAEKIKIER